MIPEFLVKELKSEYGVEIAEKIIKGYSLNRPTTFRINTIKSNKTEIEENLTKNGIEFQKFDGIQDAYIIKNNEINIENLEIYKDGKIYLQSLSSMLPPIFLNPLKHNDILDMAAAPGGKTTQIAAITCNEANITACEMNNIRFERLKYNVEKQGATSVYLMKADSRKINNMFSFDQILLDAPCSGSGILNEKDTDIEKYFTPRLIEKTTKLQIELLEKALKILKSGHEMIYSTCSVLRLENEDILNKVLKNNNAEIVPLCSEEINNLPKLPTTINGCICLYPNELFEGFFIAKIRKN